MSHVSEDFTNATRFIASTCQVNEVLNGYCTFPFPKALNHNLFKHSLYLYRFYMLLWPPVFLLLEWISLSPFIILKRKIGVFLRLLVLDMVVQFYCFYILRTAIFSTMNLWYNLVHLRSPQTRVLYDDEERVNFHF